MPDLSTQLREYFEATASPIDVEEIISGDPWVPSRRTPPKRSTSAKWTYGVAAAVAVLVAILGLALLIPGGNENEVADTTPSTSPSQTLVTAMWPQSNLEEVQQAQELADAGDPDYTWQVDEGLASDEYVYGRMEEGRVEIFDRFVREVLGWEAYQWNPGEIGDDFGGDGTLTDQRFLRCAPDRTNPLYPPRPSSDVRCELCAPTMDELTYESVSLDLAQLARRGSDGIWVVSRWGMTAPFAQVDPTVAETQATEHLEEFLAARIAGNGAEGYVEVYSGTVPLLYATTSGAPYERYEIDVVDGPIWPYAFMTFQVRLYADGEATVVEQEIHWNENERFRLDEKTTIENGQPIVLSHTSSDGDVTVSTPSTWEVLWESGVAQLVAPDVWFGLLRPVMEPEASDQESIGFVAPVAYDAWCAANGGAPLLSAPGDAAAIAQQVIADPNFETTAPVAVRVGGLEAVSIDAELAPLGRHCGTGITDLSRWIHELWDPGFRLRLYLVDLPEGMSVETLAITVVAPKERFEQFIAETAPIIDSIEFHTG